MNCRKDGEERRSRIRAAGSTGAAITIDPKHMLGDAVIIQFEDATDPKQKAFILDAFQNAVLFPELEWETLFAAACDEVPWINAALFNLMIERRFPEGVTDPNVLRDAYIFFAKSKSLAEKIGFSNDEGDRTFNHFRQLFTQKLTEAQSAWLAEQSAVYLSDRVDHATQPGDLSDAFLNWVDINPTDDAGLLGWCEIIFDPARQVSELDRGRILKTVGDYCQTTSRRRLPRESRPRLAKAFAAYYQDLVKAGPPQEYPSLYYTPAIKGMIAFGSGSPEEVAVMRQIIQKAKHFYRVNDADGGAMYALIDSMGGSSVLIPSSVVGDLYQLATRADSPSDGIDYLRRALTKAEPGYSAIGLPMYRQTPTEQVDRRATLAAMLVADPQFQPDAQFAREMGAMLLELRQTNRSAAENYKQAFEGLFVRNPVAAVESLSTAGPHAAEIIKTGMEGVVWDTVPDSIAQQFVERAIPAMGGSHESLTQFGANLPRMTLPQAQAAIDRMVNSLSQQQLYASLEGLVGGPDNFYFYKDEQARRRHHEAVTGYLLNRMYPEGLRQLSESDYDALEGLRKKAKQGGYIPLANILGIR